MLRISLNHATHSYSPLKQNLADDSTKSTSSSSISSTSRFNSLTNYQHTRKSNHNHKLIMIENNLVSSNTFHVFDTSRSFKKENFFIKDRSISDETSTNTNSLKSPLNLTNKNVNNSAKTFYHGFPGIFSIQADSRKKTISHSNSMCSVRGDVKRYDPRNVQKIVLDWCVEQCKNYSVRVYWSLFKRV